MTSSRSRETTDMWLVVHVPKTAGTSLRWALEKYFGKTLVIGDYGPQSDATSDMVREYLYSGEESRGVEGLIKEFSGKSAKVLIGHFPLQKYADYIEPKNIITFVREPLVRICSEFLHRVRNETFQGAFTDFLQCPEHQNVQTQLLSEVSEDSFLGVTEQYRESLGYLNKVFGWELKTQKKNVAWLKGGQKFARNLSAQELDLFHDLNQMDINHYQNAKLNFNTCKRSGRKGESFSK